MNIAALKLGQLVAAGQLSNGEVVAALERGADACGLVMDDGLRSVKQTITSGLQKGLSEPRDLSHVGKLGP